MKDFFFKILFGNLVSKIMLIVADGLAVLALPGHDFGGFALLQGLILSGSVIAAWGSDQAVISVLGRSDIVRHDIAGYLSVIQRKVAFTSFVAAACVAVIAMGSRVSFSPYMLLASSLIIMFEAQLIVNAAMLRAWKRPYMAVILFDGLRHSSLLVGAITIYFSNSGFESLVYFWLFTSFLSFSIGALAKKQFLRGSGGEALPAETLMHAGEIKRFSGLWAVMQSVVSRVVLVVSAYLLVPDELGQVAFFLKLMVVFTFLQTVMVQALAPVIGRLATAENRDQARSIYRLSTFFLAATVSPIIGASLLAMDRIVYVFGVSYSGAWWPVTFLFFAQALNIGTGVIGQFILHFGYARLLLLVTIIGASFQCLLLFGLGHYFGVDGILISYAVSNVVLVILKNFLAARKVGFHGFSLPNLTVVGLIVAEVLILEMTTSAKDLSLAWLLFGHAVFCVFLVSVASVRVPEVFGWVTKRFSKDA